MSILGVIVRIRPEHRDSTEQALRALPGVDLALPPEAGDGRLVVVIEDSQGRPAAATMAEVALWPQVLGTALVYEYSGPDLPEAATTVQGYADWRNGLADLRAHKPDDPAPPTPERA
ncbi:chaperone NapD [Aquabacterium sp. OR-4]|uniref:chaperone NapD n=1 Tax=Aquabacterium sp. OR-4 TaxID=2978127 RepID=UPI0028C8CEDB|nr:chaperone NapD [Aquabacterium sp. OR-4]MDT7838700.1 chaperone NapD [Aquabacterium sp. OR-4]